jgi:hypothetical protein
VSPPSLSKLSSPLYNITAQDITAGALHTYRAGGLNYDDSQINSRIRNTISLNSSDSFLVQGVRFQGVWTLPVCDVGRQAGWVANAADGMMPCCCGPDCAETETAWKLMGIPKRGAVQAKCKTQCPSCASGNAAVASVDGRTSVLAGGVVAMLVASWLIF